MTGITVSPDPSLLRGADPQGLRNALSVSKLAAMLPTADLAQSGAQTANGMAVQGHGVSPMASSGARPDHPALTGSTRETLSFAARAILDVLERPDAPAPRATVPLLPSPPAATAGLRTALEAVVGQSGLFYESHLAEWVRGARSLVELLKEPQATIRSATNRPGAAAAPPPQHATVFSPAAQAPLPLLPATAKLVDTGIKKAVDHDQDLPSPPQSRFPGIGEDQPAAPPAISRATSATQPHARGSMLPSQAAQAYEAVAREAEHPVVQDSRVNLRAASHVSDDSREPSTHAGGAGPIMHPASEGIVRQQLELLATQQFRWAGEAWAGVPMAWEIQRDCERSGAGIAECPEGAWTTRLLLSLPELGPVEASLTLNGTGLEARLLSPDRAIVSRMNAARSALSGNLAANGIVLMRLAVDTGEPAWPGAQP